MKHFTLAIAAVLCGSSILGTVAASDQPLLSSEQWIENLVLRKGEVAQIRSGYLDGKYDAFLNEMNDAYEKGFENEGLSRLAKERTSEWLDSEWVAKERLLTKERDNSLLEAVQGQDTAFASKVRNISQEITTPEQEKAIDRLHHFRQMGPNSGKNKDENAVIDLDLEYEYKAVQIDLPLMDGQTIKPSFEKHFVLLMEHADKLLAAAQGFEDELLKVDIALYAQNFDDRLAQSWDQQDLYAMLKGKKKFQDQAQAKVASLLKIHQEKIADLTRQMIEAERAP